MTEEQQKLVTDNIKFAYYLVNKRMKNQNVFEREDLDSIAREALCRAALLYDSSRGCKFINFAKTVINNTIFVEIRDKIRHDQLEAKAAKKEAEPLPYEVLSRENEIAPIDFAKALEELPMQRKDIFIDHHLNGFSYKEIMLKYQLTSEQVKYSLREARKAIRGKIA